MQKIILIIFFTGLVYHPASNAQSQKKLSVGDKAPDLVAHKWIKGGPIEAMQPNKIYVIEFGATWCTPCAAAIPELSALAENNRSDVVVASIFVMENPNGSNPEYISRVEKYVKKRDEKIHYSVGVDDPQSSTEKAWLTRAGLIGIPHIFVIDKNRVIRWIGSDSKQVAEVIKEIQVEKKYVAPTTLQSPEPEFREVIYDPQKLLLIEGNGGKETDFLFRSLLTKYDGKIRGVNVEFIQNFYWLKPDSVFDEYEDKLELIGVPIEELYHIAYTDTFSYSIHGRSPWLEYPDPVKNPYHKTNYGNYWHVPVIEVADKAPFVWKWKSYYNRYNYSLKVPKKLGTALFLQSALRRDLDTYFGYYASVETRSMPYWSLKTTDKSFVLSTLKSKDQSLKFTVRGEESGYVVNNGIVRDIISFLGTTYGYRSYDNGKLPASEQAAFIDETGITEKLDFFVDRSMTFEQTQAHLKSLGFTLTREYKPMKTVVIRDVAPIVNSR